MNKMVAATSWIVSLLFVSLFVGALIYYNGVVNDKNATITFLKGQVGNLTSQISDLKDEKLFLEEELTNLTQYPFLVRIANFSSGLPSTVVYSVTEYPFSMVVQNIGKGPIQNITVIANVTLSDGESSSRVQTNYTLGIGETITVRGTVFIDNVLTNVMNLGRHWSIVLTTQRGIFAEFRQ